MGSVANKVVIDAMNSVRAKPEGYNNTFEALTALTADAEIVKCFNTTGFENMANPVYPNGLHIDMFMAGDSKIAKEIASHLAKDLGFENCYDFGGSDKVALLEQLVLIWINMAMSQGLGRNFAFKIVKR
jgi:predicted dinucleotide-binding enzyme